MRPQMDSCPVFIHLHVGEDKLSRSLEAVGYNRRMPEPNKPAIVPAPAPTGAAHLARRRQSPLRALWRRDVPDARRLALPGLPLQDRLLRLVNGHSSNHTSTPPLSFSRRTRTDGCARRRAARADRGGPAGRRAEVPSSGTASRASCRCASGSTSCSIPARRFSSCRRSPPGTSTTTRRRPPGS